MFLIVFALFFFEILYWKCVPFTKRTESPLLLLVRSSQMGISRCRSSAYAPQPHTTHTTARHIPSQPASRPVHSLPYECLSKCVVFCLPGPHLHVRCTYVLSFIEAYVISFFSPTPECTPTIKLFLLHLPSLLLLLSRVHVQFRSKFAQVSK